MQFRRFVAYIYEYVREEKAKNRGYVRVEQRGAQCVFEVHLSCRELAENSVCKIYGFVRKGQGMDGILLGTKKILSGKLDCYLITETQKIGKQNISLEDLAGMILQTDQGAFFGTEWDDKPIIPGEFQTEKITKVTTPVIEKEITPPVKEPVIEIEEFFCPFTDLEFIKCRKIQIEDLEKHTYRECALKNNRFLQHGYYNFGHLLLAQKESGQKILGVPGGYNQQERFMAGMFGFPDFKESYQIEIPQGKGGYWYRIIETPNKDSAEG